MTATIPVYAPLVERVDAGEPFPSESAGDHAIGMPESARRSSCSSLRTRARGDRSGDRDRGRQAHAVRAPVRGDVEYREGAGPLR